MYNPTHIYWNPELSTFFSGKYRDAIFSDKMIYYPNSGDHADNDVLQEYKINFAGYRGPEFAQNIDLLFAGCSFTYGMGVPENGIWGSIVANKTNKTYNNLSQNGASIPWLVKQLFAYFKQYGNPKTLLCLFPNPTRLFFTSDSDILVADGGHIEESTVDFENKRSVFNTELSHLPSIKDMPKYSKRPHNLEDVINVSMVIQISMQNIRMLEQYCRSSGIEFLWSTWSEALSSAIEMPGGLAELYDFGNYVKSENDLWSTDPWGPMDKFYGDTKTRNSCTHELVCDCMINCHEQMQDIFNNDFYAGSDNVTGQRHFGVHRHIHYAESFMNRMK